MKLELPIINGVKIVELNNWPGYAVSNDGHIWSCKVQGRWGQISSAWRKLRPAKNSSRSSHLHVYLRKNGRSIKAYIHRIVLEAFVGPCPPGSQACHADDNAMNNAIENLRWDSPMANKQDMAKNGRYATGVRAGAAKLDVNEVVEIRRLCKAGKTQLAVANLFGVSQPTISAIVRNVNWISVS